MGTRVPPPCPTPAICDGQAVTGLPQLIDDLQHLLEDQESADVMFICGRDEEKFYAHRIILMARCKSFKFNKRGPIARIPNCTISASAANSTTSTTIRVPHFHPNVFKQFIQYVYTAKILLQDCWVFEMMTLAQDMGCCELRAACEDHVVATLSVDNACSFLTAAMAMNEKSALGDKSAAASFLERCIVYIGENARECCKRKTFLNLNKEALIKLISSDYFCLEEEEVWRHVLAWAKKQALVTVPTAHWSEDERARVCQHLKTVIGHVRLLLIDSQVFAEEVEPTGAVSMELSLERYRYAALLNSNKAGVYSSGTGANKTEVDKRLQPRLTVNMFPGSQILKNDKLYLQTVLNNWYGVSKQSWRLLYRASTHGFSSNAFHRYCDGMSPCLVICLGSTGEISGGFTDVAWPKTCRKGVYIHSEKAFLFALHSSRCTQPQKFDIVKKPYAICYHPDCGPIFGAGADLLISNNCNTNKDSYSNLPHSYDGRDASHESLFGDYNFSLSDYEVYTISSACHLNSTTLHAHTERTANTYSDCINNCKGSQGLRQSGGGSGGAAANGSGINSENSIMTTNSTGNTNVGVAKANYERY